MSSPCCLTDTFVVLSNEWLKNHLPPYSFPCQIPVEYYVWKHIIAKVFCAEILIVLRYLQWSEYLGIFSLSFSLLLLKCIPWISLPFLYWKSILLCKNRSWFQPDRWRFISKKGHCRRYDRNADSALLDQVSFGGYFVMEYLGKTFQFNIKLWESIQGSSLSQFSVCVCFVFFFLALTLIHFINFTFLFPSPSFPHESRISFHILRSTHKNCYTDKWPHIVLPKFT